MFATRTQTKEIFENLEFCTYILASSQSMLKKPENTGLASVAAINHVHEFVDGLGIVTGNFHCRESCAKNKQFGYLINLQKCQVRLLRSDVHQQLQRKSHTP